MAFDEKKAREFVEEVLKRLSVSSDKYKDAYVVNNMTKELSDEFYDIVGWMLMMSYRMKEAADKVIYDFDNIYWDKFLANQDTDFLMKMKEMIQNELYNRIDAAVGDIAKVNEKIQEEIERDAS